MIKRTLDILHAVTFGDRGDMTVLALVGAVIAVFGIVIYAWLVYLYVRFTKWWRL